MANYEVYVDENLRGESKRRLAGTFKTLPAALATCRGIVDARLAQLHSKGMKAQDLFDAYCLFEEDTWIKGQEFLAIDYARKRSFAICAEGD